MSSWWAIKVRRSHTHTELRLMQRARDGSAPSVYVLRDDASILYVGKSPNGVTRPMTGLKIGYAQATSRPNSWRNFSGALAGLNLRVVRGKSLTFEKLRL